VVGCGREIGGGCGLFDGVGILESVEWTANHKQWNGNFVV
jgi:hypothetical protein